MTPDAPAGTQPGHLPWMRGDIVVQDGRVYTRLVGAETNCHHSSQDYPWDHADGESSDQYVDDHIDPASAVLLVRGGKPVTADHPAPPVEPTRRRCICDRVREGAMLHTSECDAGAPVEPSTTADPWAWVDEPTDSESGDAEYNPDVWKLRERIRNLRQEMAARDAELAQVIAYFERMATAAKADADKARDQFEAQAHFAYADAYEHAAERVGLIGGVS